MSKSKPTEGEKLKYRDSFLPGKSYQEVEQFFQNQKKHKLSEALGAHKEKVKNIEKKSKPLGVFILEERKGTETHKKKIFVDLNSAEIYSVKGVDLKRDPIVRKILELSPEIQDNFLHLMEHKTFDYEDFPRRHLSILEKKGLAHIAGKGKRSHLVSLTDHLIDVLRIIGDSVGTILGMEPSRTSRPSSETPRRVSLGVRPPHLDRTYNLDFYLQRSKSRRTPEAFEPDEINYDFEEIKRVLGRILSGEGEIKFKGISYLPYYFCTYTNASERHLHYFPLKFKSFTSHLEHLGYRDLYNFIDKAPEIPFLFLAFLYAAYVYPNLEKIAFVFSNSFIFVFLALLIGFALKTTFKKERAVPYLTNSIIRYGFPSLHSLTSIGAMAFVYFIPEVGPLLSLALLPLGILYIYSRLKLKVHSLRDVIGGGIFGLVLGSLCGYFLLYLRIVPLSYVSELVLTFLFFLFPFFTILYRVKAGYLP